MSAVIAICSNNFCTFLSDGRKVTHGETGIEVVDEDAQKIFQINPRVLFGACGWFMGGEQMLDAIADIDVSTASPKVAKAAIINYLKKHRVTGFPKRNYLVGGKTAKGFELYKVSYEQDGGKIVVEDYSPTQKLNYGIAVGLPDLLAPRCNEVIGRVSQCVVNGGKHEIAMLKVENIIKELTKEDDSINDHINRISIF